MMKNSNPMMVVRSLKGCPASVLWALILARHAMTARELCDYTGYKIDAVRDAMRVLAGYDLVVENRLAHGEAVWALAQGAQLMLPGLVLGEQKQIKSDSDADLVIDAPAQNWEKSTSGENAETQKWIKSSSKNGGNCQNWEKSSSDGQNSGQNWEKSTSEGENQGSINLIDDDESLSIKTINHHQSEPEKNRLAAILENTAILWGDHLTLEDVPAGTSPDLALAWVCKVWVDIRSGNDVKNPTGLLRARLRSQKKRRVLHDDLLPDEYREAVGLPVVERLPLHERVEQALEQGRQELADEQAEDSARQELIYSAVAEPVREAWRAWWETSDDFSRAHRQTWLSDTVPVSWDGRTLTVAARNDYAADWLGRRIARVAMMGVEVDVIFTDIKTWLEGK